MNSLIENLNSKTFIKTVLNEANIDTDINIVYKKLSVSLLKDSQVIKLKIIGNDKEKCIKILQAFHKRAKEVWPSIIKNSKVEVIDEAVVSTETNVTEENRKVIFIIL